MGSNQALILFSCGLDSTTVLHHAISQGYKCTALTIDYNQRHKYEIQASKNYLKKLQLNGFIFKIDLTQIGGSALTDSKISVPISNHDGIPVTYVPARNTIFLSIAAAYAEKMHINDIFIGVNQVDYSGYPDCRPEFIQSFSNMINLGTKTGVDGRKLNIHTPLIDMSKSEIIKYGDSLGVDYSQTVSCYQLDNEGRACGKCDSCKFRKEGFRLSGVKDQTIYKN
jgi:7-cyano-7-deazaguanine synthase